MSGPEDGVAHPSGASGRLPPFEGSDTNKIITSLSWYWYLHKQYRMKNLYKLQHGSIILADTGLSVLWVICPVLIIPSNYKFSPQRKALA